MSIKTQFYKLKEAGFLDHIFQALESSLTAPVQKYLSASERLSENHYKLEKKSSSESEVLADALNFIKNSINTNHPLFVNQLYSGAHPISWYAEFIVAALNTSMATYEIAPVGTLMEKEIVLQFADLLNMQLEGLMVPGGSYANMMGLHLARYQSDPKIKIKGYGAENKFKIFISDQAHYSYKKSMNIMGLGEDNIVIIKSDSRKKMDLQDLESQIQKCLSENNKPLAVGSTLGTTVYGALDPVEEIQKICSEYKIWHHVDAAWGAPLVVSGEFPEKLKHKFDSLTLDFHKSLGLTLCKSFVLTPHKELLLKANHGGGSAYLFHETENENYNTGSYAIQCGRKLDSFPVWLTWKLLGTDGFKDNYQKQRQLCLEAFDYLNTIERINCLHNPEFLNLCFQVEPKDPEQEKNQYQKDLRQKLVESNELFLNFSTENNKTFFRWSFANQSTSLKDFKKAIVIMLELDS